MQWSADYFWVFLWVTFSEVTVWIHIWTSVFVEIVSQTDTRQARAQFHPYVCDQWSRWVTTGSFMLIHSISQADIYPCLITLIWCIFMRTGKSGLMVLKMSIRDTFRVLESIWMRETVFTQYPEEMAPLLLNYSIKEHKVLETIESVFFFLGYTIPCWDTDCKENWSYLSCFMWNLQVLYSTQFLLPEMRQRENIMSNCKRKPHSYIMFSEDVEGFTKLNSYAIHKSIPIHMYESSSKYLQLKQFAEHINIQPQLLSVTAISLNKRKRCNFVTSQFHYFLSTLTFARFYHCISGHQSQALPST